MEVTRETYLGWRERHAALMRTHGHDGAAHCQCEIAKRLREAREKHPDDVYLWEFGRKPRRKRSADVR